MNKTKIGIFLSLMLVLGFCSSCGEKESNSKLLLNEVLITNESNFQDDYGVHSAWIEIFNKSYGSEYFTRCFSQLFFFSLFFIGNALSAHCVTFAEVYRNLAYNLERDIKKE